MSWSEDYVDPWWFWLVSGARRFVTRLTSPDAADDVIQDSRVKLLPYADGPIPSGRRKFVTAVLRSCAMDWLRQKKRRIDSASEFELEGATPLTAALNPGKDEAAQQEINQAIGRLPKEHREIIVMIYLAGMTLMEVAKKLGVSHTTVANRREEAFKIIKRMRKNDDDDGAEKRRSI